MSSPTARDWALFAMLGFAFFLCAEFSFAYTKEFGRVACMWPANAFTLAVLLRVEEGRRVHCILAAFLGNLLAALGYYEVSPAVIGVSMCNMIEIGLCLLVLTRMLDRPFDLGDMRHIRIGLLAAILAPLVSGLGAMTLAHTYRGLEFANNFVVWASAHILGLVVFAPLFMSLGRESLTTLFQAGKRRRTLEILALLVATLGIVFFQNDYPLLFVPMAVLVLAAFQLGVPGAAICACITAVVVIAGAVLNHGPMSLINGSLTEKVLITQMFIGAVVFVSLPVASAVSQRARLAQDLVREKEAAQRANQAKSEFLTAMSHELRTPLNAISGFAQLLNLNTNRDAREREYVGYILNGGDHLIKLVSDVLDLAKVEAGRIEINSQVFSANELVREVAAVLTPMAAQKNITLKCELCDRAANLDTDIGRLKQVLINFGTNAIKYNRPNGTATIALEVEDGHARMIVSDTGPGIAPERQAGLFQPFNRLGHENGPIEGTGIGLAISRRLIEAMGGTLGFESAVGFGTRFWVDLPCTLAETQAPERAPMPVRNDSRMTILYIEDNKANAQLMSSITRDFLNAELVVAERGEEGLASARELNPDLIISDIHLPDTTGYELFRRLRGDAATAHIPVIALTADAMPHTIEQARQAGFDDFFTKPFHIPDMLRAIQAHARRPMAA